MRRIFQLILLLATFPIVLGVSSLAMAQTDCRDCIFDADGDGANEEEDDFLICAAQSEPWSATCEAWDLNGDLLIGIADAAIWDNDCGPDPIVCGGGCQDCIFDADGDGFNEEGDDGFNICLGESDPTWSTTCEAWDLDGSNAVGTADIAIWDNDCGAAPISCEFVTTTSVPALSLTGQIATLMVIAMTGAFIVTLYSSRERNAS